MLAARANRLESRTAYGFAGYRYDGIASAPTHYNYYRDYDPSTGRYIQSDPIGLDAGPNTYAYVEGDPLANIDPSGLLTRPVSPGPVRGPDAGAQQGGSCGVNRTRNRRNYGHTGVDLLHPAGGIVVAPIGGTIERSGPEGAMICRREGEICCGGTTSPKLICYRLVHVDPTVASGGVSEGQSVATIMPQTNPNIPPHVHVELYETECSGNNPKLKRKCPPF
jgi:RHS repeat-associated protein